MENYTLKNDETVLYSNSSGNYLIHDTSNSALTVSESLKNFTKIRFCYGMQTGWGPYQYQEFVITGDARITFNNTW